MQFSSIENLLLQLIVVFLWLTILMLRRPPLGDLPVMGTRRRRLVSLHLGLASAVLASGTFVACSPYPYSDASQTLGSKVDSFSTSYDAAKKRITAERQLNERLMWGATRPFLKPGPGCNSNASASSVCTVVDQSDLTPSVVKAGSPPNAKQAAQVEDVCHVQPESSATPTQETVRALKTPERDDVVEALKGYTSALVAITKAQDRADFDAAAGKASAAVGSLVESAASASGNPVAGPVGSVAKASTNAALWLTGQALDYQRLQQLRLTTEAACEPVHALTIALAFMLEEQRLEEMRLLRQQLTWNVQAANSLQRSSDKQKYQAAIEAAQASADAYQNIRLTEPGALANSLRNAHDKLVLAVRNNTGERDALIDSLNTFAKYANQFESAANDLAKSSNKSDSKKS